MCNVWSIRWGLLSAHGLLEIFQNIDHETLKLKVKDKSCLQQVIQSNANLFACFASNMPSFEKDLLWD